MVEICVHFNHQPSGWEHKFTFFTPDRYSTDQNSLPAPADIIPQGVYLQKCAVSFLLFLSVGFCGMC